MIFFIVKISLREFYFLCNLIYKYVIMLWCDGNDGAGEISNMLTLLLSVMTSHSAPRDTRVPSPLLTGRANLMVPGELMIHSERH